MCLKSSVSESWSWDGYALHAGEFPLLQHTWFKWIARYQDWFQTDALNRTKTWKTGAPSHNAWLGTRYSHSVTQGLNSTAQTQRESPELFLHCVCLHALLSRTKVQVVHVFDHLYKTFSYVSCAFGVNLHHLLEYCWLWQTFCCSFCLEPLWRQVLCLLS